MENRTIEILGHKLTLAEFTNDVQKEFMYYSQDSGLTELEKRQTKLGLQMQVDAQGITRDVTLDPLEQLEVKKLLKVADKKADEYQIMLDTEGEWSDEFIEQVTKAGQELKDLQDKIYALRYQEQKLATKTTTLRSGIDEMESVNEEIKYLCLHFIINHVLKLPAPEPKKPIEGVVQATDPNTLIHAKPSDYTKAVEWIREGKEYLTLLAKDLETGNRASRRNRGASN
jgi:hypothetical protein